MRVSGHFGEWLQGRLGAGGPVVLVTVACPALAVRATRLGGGPLSLLQGRCVLDPDLARALLDRLGLAHGWFRIESEMPPGGGAGASTAALIALARAAGFEGSGLIEACLAVEGASDPLTFPQPDAVLWASRMGRVIDDLAPPPPAEIVGGFWGNGQRTDPADEEFPDVADLVDAWRGAETLAQHAAIAAESARRCTLLRGPGADPIEALAGTWGALGHLRAHTGSARGLIFAPGTAPAGVADALRAAGLAQVLRFATGAAR